MQAWIQGFLQEEARTCLVGICFGTQVELATIRRCVHDLSSWTTPAFFSATQPPGFTLSPHAVSSAMVVYINNILFIDSWYLAQILAKSLGGVVSPNPGGAFALTGEVLLLRLCRSVYIRSVPFM